MISLLLSLLLTVAQAQQTIGPAQTIKLTPVSLPATCANGDISVSSSTFNLSVCSSNTWLPFLSGLVNLSLSSSVTGTLGVANGGTGLVSGTNGGIPAFNSASTMVSTGVLSANEVVVGGGANSFPATLGAGSQFNLLTRNSSMPVWGQVQLNSVAAVVGTLGMGNGGTNNNLPGNAGGMLYTDGTRVQNTGAGTSGYLMTSAGTGAPSFQPLNASSLTGTVAVANGGTGLGAVGSAGTTITSTGSANQYNLGKPSGEVFMVGGSSCPSGSHAADGTSLLRSGDSTCSSGPTGNCNALFAQIGTTYGSADGTHFTLPDMRGIFVRGSGTSGALTNANGSAFAATLGTYQNDEMQGHVHSTRSQQGGGGGQTPSVSAAAGGTLTLIPNTTGPVADGTNGTPRAGLETNPANLALLYCIAY